MTTAEEALKCFLAAVTHMRHNAIPIPTALEVADAMGRGVLVTPHENETALWPKTH